MLFSALVKEVSFCSGQLLQSYNWSKCCECVAVGYTALKEKSVPTLNQVQGTLRKSRRKDCNNQEMGRGARKCCLGALMWPLHT